MNSFDPSNNESINPSLEADWSDQTMIHLEKSDLNQIPNHLHMWSESNCGRRGKKQTHFVVFGVDLILRAAWATSLIC